MGHPSFITIILLLVLLVFPLGLIRGCADWERYQIQIIDDLPSDSPQLKFHCGSPYNDFGIKFLSSTQNFTWSFCDNRLGGISYQCHFWWSSKDSVFDVFDDRWYCIRRSVVSDDYILTCAWVVRPEGFYLGTEYEKNGTLKKQMVYEW